MPLENTHIHGRSPSNFEYFIQYSDRRNKQENKTKKAKAEKEENIESIFVQNKSFANLVMIVGLHKYILAKKKEKNSL